MVWIEYEDQLVNLDRVFNIQKQDDDAIMFEIDNSTYAFYTCDGKETRDKLFESLKLILRQYAKKEILSGNNS